MKKMLKQEIGSFYEWEDIHAEWFEKHSDEQNKTSALSWISRQTAGQIQFFESGRSAIGAIIEYVSKMVVCKVALLPSYICDTVITPFIKRGWTIHFYQLNRYLEPELEELENLIRVNHPSVILTVPYYGMKLSPEVYSLLYDWHRAGGLIVEDLTQSLFLLHSGNNAVDYQVVSLRKWLPIAAGGILSGKLTDCKFKAPNSDFITLKMQAQKEKYHYLSGGNADKDAFLKMHRAAEDNLNTHFDIYGMDLDAYGALAVYDIDAMRTRRSKNAQTLQSGIIELSSLKPVVILDQNVIPLYYPIYADDRESLQSFLKRQEIYAPILWEIPQTVIGSINDNVQYIYDHLLALPCDHRYGANDMHRLIDALVAYDKERS